MRRKKANLELSHPSAREPMFAIVGFVQMADDDTAAGAGMDESPLFQIDAYVGGTTLTTSVVKEYKVAFAQIPFALFMAI